MCWKFLSLCPPFGVSDPGQSLAKRQAARQASDREDGDDGYQRSDPAEGVSMAGDAEKDLNGSIRGSNADSGLYDNGSLQGVDVDVVHTTTVEGPQTPGTYR